MAQVRLSTVAQADFDEILDYLTQAAGTRTAADYAERLRACVNRIAEFPGLGSPRRRLGPQTRATSVDPYLIFLRRRAAQQDCACPAHTSRSSQHYATIDRSRPKALTAIVSHAASCLYVLIAARSAAMARCAVRMSYRA